jgi:tetratricopeptide (TPR) repeat protein
MRRMCLGVVLVLVAAACASAPIKPDAQRELGRADQLIAKGCYDCLIEARGIYEHAAVAKARPLVVSRLFESDVLIALREREIGTPETGTLASARALVPELPSTYDAASYLAMADAIPPDAMAMSRIDANAFTRAHGAGSKVTAWIASLDAGVATQPFRQYLAIALDCAYQSYSRNIVLPGLPVGQVSVSGGRGGPTQRAPMPEGAVPLVRYRYASCGFGGEQVLNDLLDAQPAFVEAGIPLARLEAGKTTHAATTHRRQLLEAAYAKFPKSAAVTYLLGALFQAMGDCRAALRYYGEALAQSSSHEDALLGQTICQGHLGQSDDAIATATHMLDLKTYNMADALYWRAWNWYRKNDLPKARESSDLAKTMKFDSAIMTLAGVIEHDQDDLNLAETDLKFALQSDKEACMAQWYLGLVALKRQAWLPTADNFALAMRCYERAVVEDQKLRASMEASDVDPDFKNAQLAGFDAAIKEEASQQSAAAYNAAVNYLRAEQPDKALEYADLAAKDPDRREKADALKKIIK